MEDPKPVLDRNPNPNPANTTIPPPPQQPEVPPQSPPPPPSQVPPQPKTPSPPQASHQATPPPAAAPPLPESKKRPLDTNVQIQDCSYFKMRAIVKDLRPHLLELLRSVEFRKCEGAHKLQEKIKLLMELYKQMMSGAVNIKNIPESQPFSSARELQEPQPDRVFAKPSENKPFESTVVSEMGQADASENLGFIVGGSAFGWNFVTFPGHKPIYYGRTKESFRAVHTSRKNTLLVE